MMILPREQNYIFRQQMIQNVIPFLFLSKKGMPLKGDFILKRVSEQKALQLNGFRVILTVFAVLQHREIKHTSHCI